MNILNTKYGKLTVVAYHSLNKRNERVFKCRCECGNEKLVKFFNLNSGKTTSCGCKKTGTKIENLIGQKFFRLKVIEYVGQTKHRESNWLCKCQCGAYRIVLRKNLIYGKSKSCGCYNSEEKRKLKGILNPNFNLKLTDEERSQQRKTKQWAKKIKEIFNFTCDICSSKKDLCAHHLNGYNWDIKHRFDLKNGVCLCKNCHILFHIMNGYKHITRKQYVRFKRNKLGK